MIKTLQVLLLDLVGVAGAVLLAYGAWLAYRPAGFLVAGVLLLAVSWRLAMPPAE
jgi:hypothetical protein